MRRRLSLLIVAALLAPACKQGHRFLGSPQGAPQPLQGYIGGAEATILWNTGTPSGSAVEYGATTEYGAGAGDPTARTTAHLVTISGLSQFSYYHYRVKSLDDNGDTFYSFDRVFKTYGTGTPPGSVGIHEDFEGSIAPWTVQTFSDSQAVTSIVKSNTQAFAGTFSLQCTVHLVGGDPNFSKGEVFLPFGRHSADFPEDFMDLTNKTISVYVFPPAGATGNPALPNGVQLFVKDAAFRSHYSNQTNFTVPTEGTWILVNFTVTNTQGAGEFMDPGFDPAFVAIGGIKFGTGGGSVATYDGPIYVDEAVYQP